MEHLTLLHRLHSANWLKKQVVYYHKDTLCILSTNQVCFLNVPIQLPSPEFCRADGEYLILSYILHLTLSLPRAWPVKLQEIARHFVQLAEEYKYEGWGAARRNWGGGGGEELGGGATPGGLGMVAVTDALTTGSMVFCVGVKVYSASPQGAFVFSVLQLIAVVVHYSPLLDPVLQLPWLKDLPMCVHVYTHHCTR